MDHLWSPWRFRYVSQAEPDSGCIFCVKPAENRDRDNLIVWRARRNFVLLNLYPYTTGHLMVAPYEHVATLAGAAESTLEEMIGLAQMAERRLTELYRPQGFNVGINLGDCAGAGVAGHIHMHIVPRWTGDSNFMTTVGETRVMPEDLAVTCERLSAAFAGRG
ncbi:MAG: HIT family protein [Bryobacteraceae bacterium]